MSFHPDQRLSQRNLPTQPQYTQGIYGSTWLFLLVMPREEKPGTHRPRAAGCPCAQKAAVSRYRAEPSEVEAACHTGEVPGRNTEAPASPGSEKKNPAPPGDTRVDTKQTLRQKRLENGGACKAHGPPPPALT